MNSNTIEEFYIRLYFKVINGDYLSAAINRAYRDFSRTIKFIGISEIEKKGWKERLVNILKEKIKFVTENHIESIEAFTLWHQSTCCLICENSEKILKIGQAQKWINMTLKYLYAFGELRISGITKNYYYFHIPIDNLIQDKLLQKYSIEKIHCAWSKIKDYETYYNYQKEVMYILKDKIIMDEEFLLFNET